MTKQLWRCVLGFACLVGTPAATAQSPDSLMTGTWIGGLESDGQFEFYAATVENVSTLTGTATVPMRGLSGPLRSLSLEGDRVGCLIGRVTPCLETCLSCTVCRLTAVEAAPAGDMPGRPESVRAERRHPEIGRSLRARGGHSRRTENPIGMMRRSGVARTVRAA
jgi:hypothetical protein